MLELEKVDQLTELYRKHVSGELSETDKILLDEMLIDQPYVKRIFHEAANEEAFLNSVFSYYSQAGQITDEEIQRQFTKSLAEPDVGELKRRRMPWLRYAAAAAILLMIGVTVFLLQRDSKQPTIAKIDKEQQQPQQEIMPANGFALLVLDNGRKVVIDSMGSGVVANNGGKEIINKDGQLSYQGQSEEIVYNTLVTSRGKMMRLLLPDGSRAWLNAESTMKFPTEFDGARRLVEITGEVYLEVAKNAKKPFIVSVKGMEVQVYGTSFNINAYPEEANVKTTLIEGSVSVRNGNKRLMIKPGQQAQVSDESINVVENADVESAIAWKNGMTVLNRADIKSLLNTISRWYDVDVEVKGDLETHVFLGSIPRNLSLQDVTKALTNITNLKFEIKGRKLIVSQ